MVGDRGSLLWAQSKHQKHWAVSDIYVITGVARSGESGRDFCPVLVNGDIHEVIMSVLCRHTSGAADSSVILAKHTNMLTISSKTAERTSHGFKCFCDFQSTSRKQSILLNIFFTTLFVQLFCLRN